MLTNSAVYEGYEISSRFRTMLETRIERLEREANIDESAMAQLDDVDHIRRHMRLVAMQRADALRMRLFLDRASGGVKQGSLSGIGNRNTI